jgi:hypothetical protein
LKKAASSGAIAAGVAASAERAEAAPRPHAQIATRTDPQRQTTLVLMVGSLTERNPTIVTDEGASHHI